MARRRILILLRDRIYLIVDPKVPQTAPTGHPERIHRMIKHDLEYTMPVNDWQFWVVTAAGVVAALWLVRLVLPKKKKGKKATLTVSAKSNRQSGSSESS